MLTEDLLKRILARFGDQAKVNRLKIGSNARKYLTEIPQGKRKLSHSNITTILDALEIGEDMSAKNLLVEIAAKESADKRLGTWSGFRAACEALFHVRGTRDELSPDEESVRRIVRAMDPAEVRLQGRELVVGNSPPLNASRLIRYLGSLKASALIPNIFADGKAIPLDDVFVELQTCEVDDDFGAKAGEADQIDHSRRMRMSEQNRRRVPLSKLFENHRRDVHLIFGDPGSGKSTLLQHLLHEIGRGRFSSDSIPFLVPLKKFAVLSKTGSPSFLSYIAEYCLGASGAEVERWVSLLSYGFESLATPRRLILLLDGLDEIASDDETFTRITQAIESITYLARVIITSRRAGYRRPFAGEFERFEIIDLGNSAIGGLAGNWFKHVHPRPESFVKGFLLHLFGDEGLTEMARNPTLLSLLCYLNENREEGDYLKSESRTDLYLAARAKLVAEYETRLGEPPPGAFEKLEDFAAYLFQHEGRIPRQLFAESSFLGFSKSASVSGKLLSKVWLRSKLVGQWNDDHLYFFTHLSFQEFLAAKSLAALDREKVLPIAGEYRYNIHWREVWRFYAGLCRGLSDGKQRFLDLVNPVTNPDTRDRFGQCFFRIAPLCMEFGVAEANRLLNMRIQRELMRIIDEGRLSSASHVRQIVRMDAVGCFRKCALSINSTLAGLGIDRPEIGGEPLRAANRESSFFDDEENGMSRALDFIEQMNSPMAIEFQKELLRIEVTDPRFEIDGNPQMGPKVPSGKNELLTDYLIELLPKAIDAGRRERVIQYLTLVPSDRVVRVLLNLEQQSGDVSVSLQVLDALVEMERIEAVDLADRLWEAMDSEARFQVASLVRNIVSESTEALLEKWACDTDDPELLIPILESLAYISLSGDFQQAEKWSHHDDPGVRAEAIRLLAIRGGLGSVPLLRKILSSPRSVDDVHAVIQAAGEAGIMAADLNYLSEQAFTAGDPLTAIIAELALLLIPHDPGEELGGGVELRIARFGMALERQWLEEYPDQSAAWITTLVSLSVEARSEFAYLVETSATAFGDDFMKEVLLAFQGFAGEAPLGLVHKLYRNKRKPQSRSIAAGILARRGSGVVIRDAARDESIDDELCIAAIEENFLVFKAGWIDATGVLNPWLTDR